MRFFLTCNPSFVPPNVNAWNMLHKQAKTFRRSSLSGLSAYQSWLVRNNKIIKFCIYQLKTVQLLPIGIILNDYFVKLMCRFKVISAQFYLLDSAAFTCKHLGLSVIWWVQSVAFCIQIQSNYYPLEWFWWPFICLNAQVSDAFYLS